MANKRSTRTGATSKRATPKAKSQTKAKRKAKQRPKAKATTMATAHTGTNSIKLLSSINNATASNIASRETRRPPNNPDVPQVVIGHLNTMLNDLKTILDAFAQHLRSLDRKRLNGVGIKKLGFIERAYEIAVENPEYLPHYLTLERFGEDIQYFLDFRSLTDLCDQIREKLWNITLVSADFAYTDALDYYTPIKEAAKRRVDAAESLFAALAPFFKSMGKRTGEEPTEKEQLRDFKAMQRDKKNGVILLENKKPKLTGGVHKVIDKTYKDTAEFKDIIEGDIKE